MESIIEVSKNNDIDKIKELINKPEFKVSKDLYDIFIFCKNVEIKKIIFDEIIKYDIFPKNEDGSNHIETVKRILKYTDINPGIPDNEFLRMACFMGHKQIIKLLLNHPKVDPGNEVISLVASYNDLELLELFLKHPKVEPTNKALLNAVKYGNINIVKRLLKDQRIDPNDMNCRAILISIKKDYKEITKELLMQKNINYDMYKFIKICKKSDINYVKNMKEELNINIDKYFILLLIKYNRLDIIKEFVKYLKIKDVESICRRLIKKDNNNLLEIIISNTDINNSFLISFIIDYAFKYNYRNILNRILEYQKKNINIINLIRSASSNGYTDIVKKTLIEYPYIDTDNSIVLASYKGFKEIINLLIEHQKIVPNSWNSCALYNAVENNHLDIVKILLNIPNINPSFNNNEAIRSAINNKNTDIIKELLRHPFINIDVIIIRNIIKIGDLSLIKKMIKRTDINFVIRDLIKNKNFDIIKNLLNYPDIELSYSSINILIEFNQYILIKNMLKFYKDKKSIIYIEITNYDVFILLFNDGRFVFNNIDNIKNYDDFKYIYDRVNDKEKLLILFTKSQYYNNFMEELYKIGNEEYKKLENRFNIMKNNF